MAVQFFHIDAFSQRPFEGNPAAVCLLDAPLADSAWAQRVAAEMNLSETAFVGPVDEQGCRPLRWFTPEIEVKLCGHATLASAHALWEAGLCAADEAIRFSTRSGVLTAQRRKTQGSTEITLDFPANPASRCEPPDDLAIALGVVPSSVGKTDQNDYLIEVGSPGFVTDLHPDFSLMRSIGARGVIVSAAVGPDDDVPVLGDGEAQERRPDFISRFFAPACGVDEDPVTGSAHCALAPYWARRFKKTKLLGYQASPRGGFVAVEVKGARVILGGAAVTIVNGQLAIEAPSLRCS